MGVPWESAWEMLSLTFIYIELPQIFQFIQLCPSFPLLLLLLFGSTQDKLHQFAILPERTNIEALQHGTVRQ
jgi:hypothetical protein